MSSKTHIERLIESLSAEWNARESVGIVIPQELEDLIRKYLKYACSASAESVINIIIRRLELTPHNMNKLPYNKTMKMLRDILPDQDESYLTINTLDHSRHLVDLSDNLNTNLYEEE